MITPLVNVDITEVAKENPGCALVHSCNCFNKFGSGIAKAVREAFPEAAAADQETERGDISKLGNITTAFSEEHEVYICNMYTQYNYGYDGKRYVNYAALGEAMMRTMTYCMHRDIHKIVTYQLSCGRAGGDWEIVQEFMNRYFTPNFDIMLVTWN